MKYRTKSENLMPYLEFTNKRFDWQEKSLDRIYEDLYTRPLYRSLNRNYDTSEKVVVTCGLPQSGKTELVLSLLGIKPVFMEEVYCLTRANQKAGESSTVTAICYHKSEGSYFGMKIGKEELRFDSKDAFLTKLSIVRELVEARQYKTDVLHIFFPEYYFDNYKALITIIDLPGIDSNNERENRHVEKLYAKYLPIANTIIVVCKSSMVTRFEKSVLNDILEKFIPNWKKVDERFLVVVSEAYSTSSYLQQNNSIDDIQLLVDNSEKKSLSEVQRHLGNSIKIVTVELGDSLRRLSNYEHLTRYGCNMLPEIIKRNQEKLLLIESHILESECRAPLNLLLSWIKRITRLNNIEIESINSQKSRYEKIVDRYNDLIVKYNNMIDLWSKKGEDERFDRLEIIDSEKGQCEEQKNELKELILMYEKEVQDAIGEETFFDKKIKQDEWEIIKTIFLKLFVKINDAYELCNLNVIEINQELENVQSCVMDNNWFHRKSKNEVTRICLEKINDYIGLALEQIDIILVEIERKYQREYNKHYYDNRLQEYENEIKIITDKINENNQHLMQLENNKKEIEIINANINDMFDAYKDICRKTFHEECQDIIEKMNECKEDFMFYFIFFFLIEKDFKEIMQRMEVIDIAV